MKEQIYLSPHFKLEEFTQSKTAQRLGIDNSIETSPVRHSPDTPSKGGMEAKTVFINLKALCENVLEPLRKAYGKPIHISSGYRCPELNRAIGGSRNSQHMRGQAADLDQGLKSENLALFKLIQDLGLPFDQLIWERGGKWIHVSYRADGKNRKEIIYA